MKLISSTRPLAITAATLSLVLSGLFGSAAVAGDDRGLGVPPPDGSSSSQVGETSAAASETWVRRLHPTANNERVDLRDGRIDKVWNQHKVNFTALVRVVQQARSPRMRTSPAGVDRGVYRYRIYDYVYRGGKLVKTGNWVVIQAVIEWGDGMADRGWLVTAYPVSTNSGRPPKNSRGKTYCPAWLASATVIGPVNNDRLY